MKSKGRFRTFLISVFIVWNLFIVLFVNFPLTWSGQVERFLQSRYSPQTVYQAQLVAYRIHQYANITGLDARWEMFSNVKGYDWRYRIMGHFKERDQLLPLAGQSSRTFLQNYFFDFKEGKFRLNTASDPVGREAYAKYLCDKFLNHEQMHLQSVEIIVQYQEILSPAQAEKQGSHFSPIIYNYPLENRPCNDLS